MANADTSNIEDAVVRATHEILTKPDWSANIGICDWLKRRPAHIPAALRMILIRMRHKEINVQNHSIELLATLMKNCSDVRPHVARREFLRQFIDKVPKKLREPNAVFVLKTKWTREEGYQYERILLLIKTWARELGNTSRGRPFRELYDQLKATGCKFPSTTEKGFGSTPAPSSRGSDKKSSRNPQAPIGAAKPPAPSGSVDAGSFTDRECRSAIEAYTLLEQMLTASEPNENLRRHELIQSLLTQVVASQKSVSQRVVSTSNPTILDELLRANDRLLWVIKYYEGLLNGTMRRIKKNKSEMPTPASRSEGKRERKSSIKGAVASTSTKKKKKRESAPTIEEVNALKKAWQAKRKVWREDKSDKAARKAMRAAKKAYEDAKEAREAEDEEEDEEESDEPHQASPKPATKQTEEKKTKRFVAAPPQLFNLAPPPDGAAVPTMGGPSAFAPPPVATVSSNPPTISASTAPPQPQFSAFESAFAPPAPAQGAQVMGPPASQQEGSEDLSDPFAALAMRHGGEPQASEAPPAGLNAGGGSGAGGVDLMGLFGGDPTPAPATQHMMMPNPNPPQQPQQPQQQQQGGGGGGGDIDLLGIFG
mmetsp:Transcript_22807/g.31864  ORF Transcript_22807/g.31864 Transcript_22807/m.31864 type:complete len:596 (-) Transcript_22807:142-1929(-)|eukprot:CAMPEP_0184484468 /NCGR_PEP_ID=MMETSP0113_2-20130426/6183_1 /TAXON_ID=91329 /ORGANISM="Norrisiella sphaerica, Strain BC52" /LENGTH=595 /DNA_ID=CAMNT_0026865473 /DNA_START=272 /DNA_END=2059 /DNA_ORIENTATION=+